MRLALVFCVFLCACPAPVNTPTVVYAPVTDADPPPYTPPPTESGESGEVVALAVAGGTEQARAVLIRFLEAVRDANRHGLESLLADHLIMAQPRISAALRPRQQVLTRALRPRRRGPLRTDQPIETLVNLEALRVETLASRGEVPAGLRSSDLVVTAPLTPQGRVGFRALLTNWNHQAVVIVRTGITPQILGL